MAPCSRLSSAAGAAAVTALAASQASAHAFGTRYDLPIPLGIYLASAGVVVLGSFVVLARFLRYRGEIGDAPQIDLLCLPGMRWLGASLFQNTFGVISVALFGLLLCAGFFGNEDPFRNFAPTFVWIVWWVGMAFASALLGNLWSLVNPWSVLFAWFSYVFGEPRPKVRYPAWLDRWPTVGLLLMFAWIELIYEKGEHPPTLAALILVYSMITWTAMVLFGRETWLKKGEFVTAVFDLLSRFAPTVGRAG